MQKDIFYRRVDIDNLLKNKLSILTLLCLFDKYLLHTSIVSSLDSSRNIDGTELEWSIQRKYQCSGLLWAWIGVDKGKNISIYSFDKVVAFDVVVWSGFWNLGFEVFVLKADSWGRSCTLVTLEI
jgi:hypothetical protein